MQNKIDHFAVGTLSLDVGQEALRETLGVTVPMGSKHEAMSTHNCVMQAGHDCFFELISVDPNAPDPGRPRWFTLDDPQTRLRIAERPRALCRVVNTTDLDRVVANAPFDLGEVVNFQRGARTWRLTVPRDGSLPFAGLLPAFIEWSPGPHPSTGQQDLGVRLKAICLTHPKPSEVAAHLEALGVSHLATVTEGDIGLSFHLSTPLGERKID